MLIFTCHKRIWKIDRKLWKTFEVFEKLRWYPHTINNSLLHHIYMLCVDNSIKHNKSRDVCFYVFNNFSVRRRFRELRISFFNTLQDFDGKLSKFSKVFRSFLLLLMIQILSKTFEVFESFWSNFKDDATDTKGSI